MGVLFVWIFFWVDKFRNIIENIIDFIFARWSHDVTSWRHTTYFTFLGLWVMLERWFFFTSMVIQVVEFTSYRGCIYLKTWCHETWCHETCCHDVTSQCDAAYKFEEIISNFKLSEDKSQLNWKIETYASFLAYLHPWVSKVTSMTFWRNIPNGPITNVGGSQLPWFMYLRWTCSMLLLH